MAQIDSKAKLWATLIWRRLLTGISRRSRYASMRGPAPRLPRVADIDAMTCWLDRACADPARALVIAAVRALAESGVVEWTVLESGDVRLRSASGALYLLGSDGITRLS